MHISFILLMSVTDQLPTSRRGIWEPVETRLVYGKIGDLTSTCRPIHISLFPKQTYDSKGWTILRKNSLDNGADIPVQHNILFIMTKVEGTNNSSGSLIISWKRTRATLA